MMTLLFPALITINGVNFQLNHFVLVGHHESLSNLTSIRCNDSQYQSLLNLLLVIDFRVFFAAQPASAGFSFEAPSGDSNSSPLTGRNCHWNFPIIPKWLPAGLGPIGCRDAIDEPSFVEGAVRNQRLHGMHSILCIK